MNPYHDAVLFYDTPRRIFERPTAGSIWIERGDLNRAVCGGGVSGPVYYDAVFRPVRRGPLY